MGFEARLAWAFAFRAGTFAATVVLAVVAFTTPGLVVARLLALLLCLAALWSLWTLLDRGDRELARFVEALRFGDLSQGFGGQSDSLGRALDAAMRRLRGQRASLAEEGRFQSALVDEVPTALLILDEGGDVALANKAARRLFHRATSLRTTAFVAFGDEFAIALASIEPGKRRLTRLMIDNVAQRAMLGCASVVRGPERLRLVSVQPIQGALDQVEMAAKADLVRVLTHEIMNSMTPVTSLAQTAATLMQGLDDGRDADLTDARLAVETLARRADGIMHFVETYRAFARAPRVERRRFEAGPWAAEMRRLFAASPEGAGVPLTLAIEPDDLRVEADPDLLAQVVINLLKNGAEAAKAAGDPHVALALERLPGGRTRLTVGDNGPGIPASVADDIFLPFFTTKPAGTGVGLSLARQIVLAHDGAIRLARNDADGACFEIVL